MFLDDIEKKIKKFDEENAEIFRRPIPDQRYEFRVADVLDKSDSMP